MKFGEYIRTSVVLKSIKKKKKTILLEYFEIKHVKKNYNKLFFIFYFFFTVILSNWVR